MIRASHLPRPRLKIFALSTSTKCPMTLMRPSKPLLKINFRLRLQIHTPFYQRNIRKHSWLLNPLAPVHLSVCTIHPWPRVSFLVCVNIQHFFSPKEFGFLLLSRVAAMNKSPLLIHALSVFITFLSLRHGNVFAFFSFYAPLNKLFFCLFLYD